MNESNNYEQTAQAWATRLDKPFDAHGRGFELCLQLLEALFNPWPETVEFIQVDPTGFAERVSMYRLALHSEVSNG